VTTAPERIQPQLRPLSLGEILDVSIKICLAHWRTLLKAVLVVVVPMEIVSTIVNADYTLSSLDLSTGTGRTYEETIDELNQYLGGLAISSLLQLCAVLLATAACFRAIAQAYLGEEADWRSSLSFALRLAPALLLLTLLYVLGVLLGLVAFVAPGIWLYVAWAFALPALLVENLRGPAALGRSFQLVRGRWWRTFGVIVVGFLLATVISMLVQGVFVVAILAGTDNDALVLVLSAIAGTLGLAVSTPFQAALLTVLYFDLRVRKEGFDLELLAQGIGGGASSGATAPTVLPVLPPAHEIDRTGAPFWPPPPGWQPPPRPGGAGDGRPPDPPPQEEPPREEPARDERSREDEPPPHEPWRHEPPREDEPPDEPPRLPGVPYE
jgi:hypothetical protein